MKYIMEQYQSCKTPIRIAYFGFVCLAIGYFIKSPSVNIFYTFKSNIVLFLAEFFMNVGKIVIMNLPLIFMLNIVCKKANNASPVVMALVGYFTFIVTTMLFANQSLGSQAYASGYGINSIFNMDTGTRLPLETGMIGAFIVAYLTRVSFLLSRHRGSYSLSNIFAKDTSGIIYNLLFCFVAGLVVSYGYPLLYEYVQKMISFIGEDILDPLRIALYSLLDRIFSCLGIGSVIRYPFWFTSLGGSYQNTVTGQSVIGDISIWPLIKENFGTYIGAGRFITPYYVINMFIIPGFYIGTLLCLSDKSERNTLIIPFIGGILLSIIAGNPLPVELFMIFTSPVLFVFYLVCVGACSYSLVLLNAFLGFECTPNDIVSALPGTFPDFIINLRNINFSSTLLTIFIVGIIAFCLMLLFTILYYRVLTFDFFNSDKGDKLIDDIIESAGGIDNIAAVGSGLLKLNISLVSPELMYIEKIRKIAPKNVVETRSGISFEYGTASYAIAKRINKTLKALKIDN